MKNTVLVAIASLLIFAALAAAMDAGATMAFDTALRDAVHRTASPPLTALAFTVSFLGSTLLLGALTIAGAIAFHLRGWFGAARHLVHVMLGAFILNYAMKLIFQRPRPPAFFGALPETFSFPSGHMLFTVCFYGTLALMLSTSLARERIALWSGFALFVAAMGWSRLYLGVHYPSDILGGVLLAATWMAALRLAMPYQKA